ncbi:hypothetical protein HP934_002659, partial [Enterococcus faecalis]|nr:hypothetical protein [Enterococcus faecalis]
HNLLEIEDSLSGYENAQILEVYFFFKGTIFLRNLVVESDEDILSILEYLKESLGKIEIRKVTHNKIISIVNHSKLEEPSGLVRLEEFWGDVVSYVIKYIDNKNRSNELLIVGDAKYKSGEMESEIQKYLSGITITGVEEYKDCWIKRKMNTVR